MPYPEESSPEPGGSDNGGSEDDADMDAPTSDDMDQDLFNGPFAIKDKPRAAGDACAGRFRRLATKVKKELGNFEEEVLATIPHNLSE